MKTNNNDLEVGKKVRLRNFTEEKQYLNGLTGTITNPVVATDNGSEDLVEITFDAHASLHYGEYVLNVSPRDFIVLEADLNKYKTLAGLENENTPGFVERFYPGYHSSDEILVNDDMARIIDNDYLDSEDIDSFFEESFDRDMDRVWVEYDHTSFEIYKKSVESFILEAKQDGLMGDSKDVYKIPAMESPEDFLACYSPSNSGNEVVAFNEFYSKIVNGTGKMGDGTDTLFKTMFAGNMDKAKAAYYNNSSNIYKDAIYNFLKVLKLEVAKDKQKKNGISI